jgi:hypothetical protein
VWALAKGSPGQAKMLDPEVTKFNVTGFPKFSDLAGLLRLLSLMLRGLLDLG